MSGGTSQPIIEWSWLEASGAAAAATKACACDEPSVRCAQNGSLATIWMRGVSRCSSAVHHGARSSSAGSGSTAAVATPALTSAMACAGLRCTRSGVSTPKCSRAQATKPAGGSGSLTAIT